ncbi:MAG: tetratricopeptide repeat protein, partial [Candidatus Gastranaerophilales bacterium]|nr:tetratricopeptide repeat protein [Candidatus Gastranaerophilales bacterium]
MDSNNITEILKKAFEYKNRGEFKKSIDYFYKALALDNNSSEIISELAFLYTKLANYDRAAELYEQIISKNTDETNYKIKTDYASVCEKLRDFSKAEDILSELFKAGYDLNVTAEKLFHIL